MATRYAWLAPGSDCSASTRLRCINHALGRTAARGHAGGKRQGSWRASLHVTWRPTEGISGIGIRGCWRLAALVARMSGPGWCAAAGRWLIRSTLIATSPRRTRPRRSISGSGDRASRCPGIGGENDNAASRYSYARAIFNIGSVSSSSTCFAAFISFATVSSPSGEANRTDLKYAIPFSPSCTSMSKSWIN